MVPRRAGWNFVSREGVDEVAKMNGRGVRERIKALFGQSPGAIFILQHRLSTFHHLDSEIWLSFARAEPSFDRQFAADGRLNSGKFTVQSEIEIAIGTFAQAVQQNRRGPPAGKLEAYYIKYVGLLVGWIRHVRDDPDWIFFEKEADKFEYVHPELKPEPAFYLSAPARFGRGRRPECLRRVQEKKTSKIRSPERGFRGCVNFHERELAVHHDMSSGPFRSQDDFVRIRQSFDHRLFAEHMTTALQCGETMGPVQGWGRTDGDHRGFRRCKHFINVA